MAVSVKGREITLVGTVGADWWGDSFSHSQVVYALSKFDGDEPITVKLNSGGGIATEGSAIHALLSSFEGEVNIVIEGIAASAASLIAMAGDTISMADGAVMMIHDVSGITFGNSADHQKSIEALETLSNAYASVYAKRSGKSRSDARALMKDETWFTAEKAIENGFADESVEENSTEVAAFDYRMYAHAPEPLTALASSKHWSLCEALTRAEASAQPTGQQKEKPDMSKKPATAEATTATAPEETQTDEAVNKAVSTASADTKQRIKAIMGSDAAKGRADLAEHFAFETEMTAEAAIAALEKAPAAGQTEETNANDYVDGRSSASGQAQPRPQGKPQASLNPTDIYGDRRKAS